MTHFNSHGVDPRPLRLVILTELGGGLTVRPAATGPTAFVC
jgi:hypothetical protein